MVMPDGRTWSDVLFSITIILAFCALIALLAMGSLWLLIHVGPR